MDCKRQNDMTEDEFENYYVDNGGENCTYYEEENMNSLLINYEICKEIKEISEHLKEKIINE